jgi:hypothetical protein
MIFDMQPYNSQSGISANLARSLSHFPDDAFDLNSVPGFCNTFGWGKV